MIDSKSGNASSPDSPSAKYACFTDNTKKKILENVLLAVALLAIWGLLSIPIIMYYHPVPVEVRDMVV